MADKKKISMYFDIPEVSWFTEGNPFIGSENTFNFRIKPDDDKLRASIWYGMKCSELSEMCADYEEDKSAEGHEALIRRIDEEYDKYLGKLESGEVTGRRTYRKQ